MDTSRSAPLTPEDDAGGPGPAPADTGATAGVTELYRAHAVGLIRLAIVMLGDRAAAEDVVQDAFLGLYRHWAGLSDPANALTYARSAVLNRCRNELRQRGRSRSQELAASAGESAEAAVLIGEEHQRVLAAIRALPDRQREALVLRFYLDMSEEEAARAMGIRLTPVAIADSGQLSPAGVALSPDGSELAVARPGRPATLRVYSVATGTLLRSWSTTAPGEITAEKARPGAWQYTAMALRWSADGKQLDFAWNASAIRALDAGGPGGDLIGSSSLLLAIGTTYTTDADFSCTAAQGWQPITVTRGAEAGQGVICGGGEKSDLPQAVSGTASPSATSGAGDATCTPRNQPSIGFLESTEDGQGMSYLGLTAGETECPVTAQAGDGAYINWSNADGSVLVGSLAWDGHARFGIFRGSRFTPLPALLIAGPEPAGAPIGMVAW